MLMRLLEESGALCRGHFLLSSGRHSPAYVQCALLLEAPVRARRVGAEIAEELRAFHPDSVLSPALGGIIIGHEVAAALGVPFRFAERKGEELGLRRGFSLRQGERVVIVEDVVTTGRSTLETAALATSRGARVVAIGAIIDRTAGAGGGDGSGGAGGQPPFDVPFRSLITLDLPSYPPAECPQCQAGSSPEKPGSRPGAAAATAGGAAAGGTAAGSRLDVH
ncbi:MAG: orotate phosphoribosyltransferase [Acidobacteria bacterium]|nr:orotate phosphoribosyltransferase [Acidobacteriota bacterium]